MNEPDDAGFVPRMPHNLINLKRRDVVHLVSEYYDRLAASLSQSKIDAIVDQTNNS